ncbi:MAG: Fe-S protein assembly co-chaperone HscB, partial [Paraglaciecola sp.]
PRAEHILSLRGIDLQHEQQTIKDTAFLMQQMEWREALAELDDNSDPLDVLESLEDEITQNVKSDLGKLQSLLASEQEEAALQAADVIRKLKFLYKMLAEIEIKEEALNDF